MSARSVNDADPGMLAAIQGGKGGFRDWLTTASTEQVEESLRHVSASNAMWDYARIELQTRRGKPHWSVVPTFWLVVGSLLLGIVALAVSILTFTRT